MDTLDHDLRATDPARHVDDAAATPTVATAWHRARTVETKRTPRQRWKVLIPAGIAVVAVSTGAAVAVPFFLGVGGVQVEPDAQIAITYTTLSGVNVDCIWSVYVGELERTPLDQQLADALATTNWEGVGQDIYDQAIANPRVPQAGETWNNDTPETRDAISFKLAVLPMIERRLPEDLQGAVSQWGSTDTCTGPFR